MPQSSTVGATCGMLEERADSTELLLFSFIIVVCGESGGALGNAEQFWVGCVCSVKSLVGGPHNESSRAHVVT